MRTIFVSPLRAQAAQFDIRFTLEEQMRSASEREWRTADPGPPYAGTVPGLKRASADKRWSIRPGGLVF
jgi:hypothetical protein